ncbi:hypothetical protein H4R18_003871 [Coemansia javaensis]|uniref:P-loop containing nucleoside triphosphate hydrolase protein n=1 Tax=Coemansia javaensis TaxID=2761396 RepID=A0A9W8LH21_9FUNG|nr:hypothetical protein H4R18_003871 [Coemansia javaensis]
MGALAEQRRGKGGRKERLGRREQLERLQSTRHKMRVDALRGTGRSGGGRTQQLDARVRRARDQKDKFAAAREHALRGTATREERAQAEARILRQRSRQLKARGAPGLGFTPARFRLLPIDNEAGTDLTALERGAGPARRSLTARELRAQVDAATFGDLGLRPDVAAAAAELLAALGREDPRPTAIQALGVPEILGRTVFLAGETGCGKTLAYALPLVSLLKQDEAAGQARRERRPRALVVVPSRELVGQVTAVFKSLGHRVKIRAVGVHLGMARRALRVKADQGPIDVLVATPGAVVRYMLRDPLFTPADVRRLVVDEADSMMDSLSFGDQIAAVLDMVRRANATQARAEQCVFVSATLPKLIREQIIRRCPDVVHVTTPLLHRAPPRLTQTFVDVAREFQGQRLNALWHVLRTAAAEKHVVIFCNSKARAAMVSRELARRGIPALLLAGSERAEKNKADEVEEDEEPVAAAAAAAAAATAARPPPSDDPWERATWFEGHDDVWAPQAEDARDAPRGPPPDPARAPASDPDAEIPRFDRAEVLRAFMSSDPIPAHLLPAVPEAASKVTTAAAAAASPAATRKILVCTDLASRGLDTTCVTHVVLFDFPTTAIDYLHRAGRTARAGARGKVTALVGRRDRRLADQIRLSIRQGGTIS